MPIPSVRRKPPEAPHGRASTDDLAFARVAPWLRFTPALCAVIMGLGTALASLVIVGALMLIAEFGAIFGVHPFDLIYNNHGLRHLTGTRPLPPNGASRRFAYVVAAVWLVATILAFGLELTLPGHVLGGVRTTAAAVMSMSIPACRRIYEALFNYHPAASRTRESLYEQATRKETR